MFWLLYLNLFWYSDNSTWISYLMLVVILNPQLYDFEIVQSSSYFEQMLQVLK